MYRVRNEQLNIRCTEYEKDQIHRLAKDQGMQIGDYVRQMAMQGYAIHVNYTELRELVYEVNKIGVNINQIAHKVNSTDSVLKPDIEDLKSDMDIIWQILRTKLNEAVNWQR